MRYHRPVLFSDPLGVIDRHNRHDFLCATSDRTAARDFYDRGKPGVIALLNDDTIRVSKLLDDFNEDVRTRYVYDRTRETEVKDAVHELITPIFTPSGVTLCRPTEEGRGWNDAPHLDNGTIALLSGRQRQVEISSLPPMDDRELYAVGKGGRTDAQLETGWGNSYATYDPLFARHAPVSHLRCTLTILVAVAQANHVHPLAQAHRVPRPFMTHEKRGYIAKAFA